MGKKTAVVSAFGATGAWLSEAYHLIPAHIQMLAIVALLLGVGDFVTGIAVAAVRGALSSREARIRSIAKMAQFFGLISLGAGTSLLTQSWIWYSAAWSGVVAIEALSILENLASLESAGAKMGPASPFLRSVRRFFASFPADIPEAPSPAPSPAPQGAERGNGDG